MSLPEILAAVFDVIFAAICIFAMLYGGAPERWGAAINLFATLISSIAPLLHRRHWMEFEASTFVIDLLVLIAFVVLARVSTRYWPVWAAGFALAGVSVHIARLTMPRIGFMAYGNAEVGCTYLALFALAVATTGHLRATRSGVADIGWRSRAKVT